MLYITRGKANLGCGDGLSLIKFKGGGGGGGQ